MATYVVLVHGKPGAYGASLPDLPGCTSGGSTIDEALARVRLAADDWIEAVAESGEPLAGERRPAVQPARTIDSLRADPEFADDFKDAVMVAGVDLNPPGRVTRLNITMDEALLKRINRAASEAGESRSAWLATAAKMRMLALFGPAKSRKRSRRKSATAA
jgi:predicted RNase H-like HicB family nuclease